MKKGLKILENTKTLKEKIKNLLPEYAWFPVIVAFGIQLLVYAGLKLPVSHLELHDLSLPIDYKIPLVPQWIIIYYGAYFSWAISIYLIIKESKEKCYSFAATYIIGFLISGVIFLCYPCTLVRPEITGTGFFMDLMRFLYWIDTPTQLFPSVHILVAYYCWRCSLDCKKIPTWYKVFNFIFMILTCFSILFVRQHVILDIPSAIIVGELSIIIARWTKADLVFYAHEEKKGLTYGTE